jgi:hypothetical protein
VDEAKEKLKESKKRKSDEGTERVNLPNNHSSPLI